MHLLQPANPAILRNLSHTLTLLRNYTPTEMRLLKTGIVNVFLYKALDLLDQIPAAKKLAEKCLPQELLYEINRQHYCSGI